MEVSIQCTRGRAVIARGRNQLLLKTGQRRKWDIFHWTRYSDDTIALSGLYRGDYADAVANASEVAAALRKLGAVEMADSIHKPDPDEQLTAAREVKSRIPFVDAAGLAFQLNLPMYEANAIFAQLGGGA